MKNANGKKGLVGIIVWSSVSAFAVALIIVVNILATTVLYGLFNLVFNGPRPMFKSGVQPYYVSEYDSKKEVYNAARNFNETLAGEGFVLLKNKNGALPIKTPESDAAVSEKPKVSVFGKNSVNLAFGGSGSGGNEGKSAVDLYEGLEKAGFEYNPTLKKFYESEKQSGKKREQSGKNLDDGDTVVLATAETPQSYYTSAVKESYALYKDLALVVITRVGGEGMDMPRTMKGSSGYNKEDDHFLQLDKNETEMLAAVCAAGFEKVAVVINASAAMELGFLENPEYYAYRENIDAAIWMGYPGDTGCLALGKILNGNINPSGRTVDTYAYDLKQNPTWNNFGDNLITGNPQKGIIGGDEYSVDGKPELYYFVDYEEGVYVGYRYYETRGADDEDWYAQNVVYPFGYGLSYTDFSWKIKDCASVENKIVGMDEKYEIEIEVTNRGSVAGKDVVQLYGHAPYIAGEIEKPETVLLDFAKTSLIEPGKSDTVTLTFDPYYLASYDYKDMNKNGFKGFELDSGDYALYISHNSHDREFTIPFGVDAGGIRYRKDPVTKYDVVNRYTDCENAAFDSDTQLSVVLSRSDWEGTWPTPPTDAERSVTKEFIATLADVTTNNPVDFSDAEMPWTGEKGDMILRDLTEDGNGGIVGDKGDGIPFVNYNDERWDLLLDQMTDAEMINTYGYAAYKIDRMDSIGLPIVNCADGPVGWTCFMNKSVFYSTCSYVAQIVVGATWNSDLVYGFGAMVGEEGLVGDKKMGLPYSGWYAPGVNIHRSAFGGRNFEYFSEDPILSGKLAAAQVGGVQSKGSFAFVKHFALNEQETHRSISGDCSWVTEQAMREIFLRPFEITVKDGGTRAIMSSFNRIGTRWTGGDYRLLTEILRNEWGFNGCVLCDFNTIPEYMDSRQMAYAGGDLNLATLPVHWADTQSAADMSVLRKCMKNVCYTVVNSNVMNKVVIGYKLPLWEELMYIADALVCAAIAVWGVFVWKKFVCGLIERKKKAENPIASDSASNG